MCFGAIEYAWDDRVALRATLAEHLGVPGPEMPFLPTQDETPPKYREKIISGAHSRSSNLR